MFVIVFPTTATAGTAHEGGHRCGCETLCRGATCCCDGTPVAADSPSPPESVDAAHVPVGPCLGTVPCGGGDRPTIPSGPTASRAILPPVEFGLVVIPGDRVPGEGWEARPSAAMRRIDEPPEDARGPALAG